MHAEKDSRSALYIIQKLSDGSGLIPCKPTDPYNVEMTLKKLHGETVAYTFLNGTFYIQYMIMFWHN